MSHQPLLRQSLFIDMDGVVADFDQAVLAHFGKRPEDEAVMWKHIRQTKFFQTLPLFPKAKWFMEEVEKKFAPIFSGVYFATAASRGSFEQDAEQKKIWIRDVLQSDRPVLVSYGAKLKQVFLQRQGDVLIDDREDNIERWRNAGGIGILHKDLETSIAELKTTVLQTILR